MIGDIWKWSDQLWANVAHSLRIQARDAVNTPKWSLLQVDEMSDNFQKYCDIGHFEGVSS